MAKKKFCLSCGREYEFCPNCQNKTETMGWKKEFDEESCKEIFNAVSGYGMKLFTAKDVVGILKKYNITDTSKYKEEIKAVLDEALEIVNSESKPKENIGYKPNGDSEPKKPKFEKKSFNKN